MRLLGKASASQARRSERPGTFVPLGSPSSIYTSNTYLFPVSGQPTSLGSLSSVSVSSIVKRRTPGSAEGFVLSYTSTINYNRNFYINIKEKEYSISTCI